MNDIRHMDHSIRECYKHEPKYGTAHMWVTFLDGSQLRFDNIKIALRRDVVDPVIINGTTVTVEDDDQTFTILGVRYFSWEHQ